jgi:hypothetical protein
MILSISAEKTLLKPKSLVKHLLQKSKKLKKEFKNRRCYNCGGKGHSIETCVSRPLLKSQVVTPNGIQNKMPESAKMTRMSRYYSKPFQHNDREAGIWISDSGASNHMCCDKSFFEKLTLGVYGSITVASGESVKADGIGMVRLYVGENENAIELTLNDVLYVPKLLQI